VDIKQQVAQGRGEVVGGDREQFSTVDQVKPCEIRMNLTCILLRIRHYVEFGAESGFL
jgi:hypothetical protein